MATIEKFEDLKVWQEARKLADSVFNLIISKTDIIDFPLKDQINRSSGSIMDNIAEGFGRRGNKEFRQFLTIAWGSCSEVKSQVYRAADRKYLTEVEKTQLLDNCDAITKMINGLIKYMSSTDMKGGKFKEEEPDYKIHISKDIIS